MKRTIVFSLLAVLLVIACQDIPGPQNIDSLLLSDDGAPGEAELGPPAVVFGPYQFIRGSGEPDMDTVKLTSPDLEHFSGPFVLYVQNGGPAGTERVDDESDELTRVSSARVLLDGRDLFGPSDFSKTVASLSAEVTVGAESELVVTLASKPGSGLTIWIEGLLLPGRAVVGEEGGTVTDEDGTLELTIPEGAVGEDEEVIISAVPTDEEPTTEVAGIPVGTSIALGPAGTTFNEPITVTIDFTGLLQSINDPADLKVVHWDDEGMFVDVIDPEIDAQNNTATIDLTHFSNLRLIEIPWQFDFCSSGPIVACGSIRMSTKAFEDGGTQVVMSVRNHQGAPEVPQAVTSSLSHVIWALNDDPADIDYSSYTFQFKMTPSVSDGAVFLNGGPVEWGFYIDDRVGGSLLQQMVPDFVDGDWLGLGVFGCDPVPDPTNPSDPRPASQTCNGGWVNFSFTTEYDWDVSQIAAFGVGWRGEDWVRHGCAKRLDMDANIADLFDANEANCPLGEISDPHPPPYPELQWELEHFAPKFSGIWASSPNDVFLVGAQGKIQHFDGTGWAAQETGTDDDLRYIWGNSPSNVFAFGSNGTILHYNGSAWTVQRSEQWPPLSYVCAGTANEVYAVSTSGAILHYGGTTWSTVQYEAPQGGYDIWCSSPDDIFLVGDYGKVMHYDGASWSEQATGTDVRLTDVWGSSASDVFAAGYYGTILHYDGGTWTIQQSGGAQYEHAYDLWGTAADDVFAAVYDGQASMGKLLHYDGANWSTQASGMTEWFGSLSGTSPTNVFAAGYQSPGSGAGTIWHYDGSNWNAQKSGGVEAVAGLWAGSAPDVYAFGGGGTVLHHDVAGWNTQREGTVISNLTGVWGSTPNDVFALGSRGEIMHRDASGWTVQRAWEGDHLAGVWGSSPTDVFAVGASASWDGMILHYDGLTWSQHHSVPNGGFEGVWGSSATDVFAVGSGLIQHYNGSSWNSMREVPAEHLQGVCGTSPTDVYAAGWDDTGFGTVLHFDGVEWTSIASGIAIADNLHGIWCGSPTDIFVVGSRFTEYPQQGVVHHYDGTSWSTQWVGTSTASSALEGVWGASATEVYASGNGGTLIYYDGTAWTTIPTQTYLHLGDMWGSSAADIFIVGATAAIWHGSP